MGAGGVIYLQLFRERLSGKVHATAPKGIVGGVEAVFFKEIRKNCTRGHGRLFANTKESKKKKVGSTATMSGTAY